MGSPRGPGPEDTGREGAGEQLAEPIAQRQAGCDLCPWEQEAAKGWPARQHVETNGWNVGSGFLRISSNL